MAQLLGRDAVGNHLLAQFGQDSVPILFLQICGLLFHFNNLLAELDEFVHAGFFLKLYQFISYCA